MRFLIDVAVERAVHGGKFPQTSLCGLSVQRCLLVRPLRGEALEHLVLAVGGTSKIALHAVDPHEGFVEAPAPMPERPHRLGPAATDLGRKDGAKPRPPEARRLVRDIDTALVRAKSSTFRSDSGYRTDIITARRTISGDVLK